MSFLALMAVFLFVLGSAARAQTLRARRKLAYRQLAVRYSGHAVSGGLFMRPSVGFRYGESYAQLNECRSRSAVSARCTQLVLPWPDHGFRCDVLSPADESLLARARGLRRIPTGDEEFDRHFLVRGSDEQAVRDFLREGVRWQAERLRRLEPVDSVYIIVQRGRLLIQKPRLLRRFELLEPFVQCCLEFCDQALLTRASGIQFLNDEVVQPLEHVVCQVCGEEIRTDMVFCRRCKTPHHADCWQFTGVCSVYACGERTYLLPQAARSVEASPGDAQAS